MSSEENAHATNMGAKKKAESSRPKASTTKYGIEAIGGQRGSLLEHALDYAKRGWQVIPVHRPVAQGCSCGRKGCSSIGKHPATPHGLKDGSTDEGVIRDWWKLNQQANVGIVTGQVSGLVVVDIDPRHGGEASLAKLLKRHDNLPATATALTGGGGRHLFFVHPKDGEIVGNRSGLGEKYPGIDIKGEGGYVVATPSIHSTGRHYEWENGRSPQEIGLANMPTWLLKLLTSAPSKSLPDGTDGGGSIEAIEEGRRNDTLFKVASHYVASGFAPEEIKKFVGFLNDQKCTPPIEQGEVDRIVDGAWENRGKPVQEHIARSIRNLADAIVFSIGNVVPVDPDLRVRILQILDGEGQWTKTKVRKRNELAAQSLKIWLRKRGGFLHSEEGRLFYFDKSSKSLYDLESARWHAWLYRLTGVNPTDRGFAYLQAECETLAIHGEKRPIYRVAYFDASEKVLYSSRFDGTVFRLDGTTITEQGNGEHVLFEDRASWQPYALVKGAKGSSFREFANDLPNWESSPELYGLVFEAWIVSTFFSEIIPARPLLMMLGEKGSGKSVTLRLLKKYLFGAQEQIQGIPDKADGFAAAAAQSHIMVIDNLDDWVPWIRDKLARVATGAVDEVRKLYTSNEVYRIEYRCWVAITARTPETLRRDDLTDRLLILPVKRFAESETQESSFRTEREFYEHVNRDRNGWWTELLELLNRIVAAIRNNRISTTSSSRMADWESFGRLFAEVEGKLEIWKDFTSGLQSTQAEFLLEEDPVVEALEAWLLTYRDFDFHLTANELYSQVIIPLQQAGKKLEGCLKSPRAFARHLSTIRGHLARLFGLRWKKGTSKANLNRKEYWFEPIYDDDSMKPSSDNGHIKKTSNTKMKSLLDF
jgi:hypothetical protein